jgi:hypothetical protein
MPCAAKRVSFKEAEVTRLAELRINSGAKERRRAR